MLNILIVDNDPIDRRVIKRNFQKNKIQNPSHEANNGKEAIEILRKNIDSEQTKTWLILLDLNMPIMDGHEFLKETRLSFDFINAFVIVLSTSNSPQDRKKAFVNGAFGYIVKDIENQDFVNDLNKINAIHIKNSQEGAEIEIST